jgi:hypothetical protein
MTRTLVIFGLLAVFIAIIGILAAQSLFLITRLATVDQVAGKVEMRAAHRTDWQPVKKGMMIQVGSVIRAGAKSHAVLKWADGSRIKLDSGSRILFHKWTVSKVTGSGSASFQQFVGRVIFLIKKAFRGRQKFEVRTPTVLAAVRGTTFDVDVQSRDLTTISVLDGAVDISGSGFSDTVLAGRQSTATPDGITVAQMSDQQRALWTAQQGFIGPQVIVDSPDDGIETDQPMVAVAGMVEPPAKALVNGEPVRTEPDGRFMTRILLQEGENKIAITGQEENRVTSVTRTVTYAPTSSAISISLSPGERRDQALVTAAVADAQGKPVPDGTPVHFEAAPGKIEPQARTKDGKVTVIIEATQPGEVRIRCRSGRASAQIPITVEGGQPQPSTQPGPTGQPAPGAQPAQPAQPPQTGQPAAPQPTGP